MTLCMNQDSRVSCGCEALVGHLRVFFAGLKRQAKEPKQISQQVGTLQVVSSVNIGHYIVFPFKKGMSFHRYRGDNVTFQTSRVLGRACLRITRTGIGLTLLSYFLF